MTSRPVRNAEAGVARSADAHARTGASKHQIQQEIQQEEGRRDRPDPPQVGNDEAPEDEPSRQPRHQAAQPLAKQRRPNRDVFAAGVEAGRRLESTEREHILVHLRALRDRARSADDQKRTTDLRGAGELRVAEYDNHIPIDAAFDRRVPADDHDLADGFAGFEREVLEHPHGWVREPDARDIDFLRTDGAAAGQ
jgi:hypothetical protein